MAATSRKPFLIGCVTGAILGPILLTVLGLGVVFTFQERFTEIAANQQAARLKPPQLGTGLQADYTLALRTPSGAAQTLEDYRDKTVLLYFWHPGCVACLAGLPALKQLGDAVGESNAEILMIALGDEAEIEAIRQTYDLPFTQFILEGSRPIVFDSDNVTPAAFLIAPDGAIVFRHAGAAQWNADALAALIRAVAS